MRALFAVLLLAGACAGDSQLEDAEASATYFDEKLLTGPGIWTPYSLDCEKRYLTLVYAGEDNPDVGTLTIRHEYASLATSYSAQLHEIYQSQETTDLQRVIFQDVTSGILVHGRLDCSGDDDKDEVPAERPFPEDNCVGEYNPNQADQDSDRLGDACDPDVDGDNIWNNSDPDDDDDGLKDDVDPCPFNNNKDVDVTQCVGQKD